MTPRTPQGLITYDLPKALRRLDKWAGLGDIAKRNARREVNILLARIRRAVDATYPTPRRKPKERASPKTWGQRMRKKGWEMLDPARTNTGILRAASIIGIKLRTESTGNIWAPGWLIDHIDEPINTLRRMARDPQYRKAFLVEYELRHSGDE